MRIENQPIDVCAMGWYLRPACALRTEKSHVACPSLQHHGQTHAQHLIRVQQPVSISPQIAISLAKFPGCAGWVRFPLAQLVQTALPAHRQSMPNTHHSRNRLIRPAVHPSTCHNPCRTLDLDHLHGRTVVTQNPEVAGPDTMWTGPESMWMLLASAPKSHPSTPSVGDRPVHVHT